MRVWLLALALCVLGVCRTAVSSSRTAHAPHHKELRVQRDRRSTAINTDRWSNLLADYTRGAVGAYGGWGGAGGAGSWFPPPMPIQVPFQSDTGGRASLLVIPVPVPVPVLAPAPAPRAGDSQCQLHTPPATATGNSVEPPRTVTIVANNDVSAPGFNDIIHKVPANSAGRPSSDLVPSVPMYNSVVANTASPAAPRAPSVSVSVPAAPEPTRVAPPPPPPPPATDERLTRNIPRFPPVEDSQLLVELFRAQLPSDPSLPPVVIEPVGVVSTDDRTVDELETLNTVQRPTVVKLLEGQSDSPSADAPASPERRRLKCKRRKGDADEEGRAPAPPPLPRFESSMFVRARLTVPRADYTEPYAVWWDAASGAARVDFHGGTASSYRMVKRDGRMQTVQIRVDRTSESDVRRCLVSSPRRVSLAERALPALPDLQGFSFAGYMQRGAGRVERWRHTVSGHSGELGGAQGEALTFRHELLVSRAPDNYTSTPLRYSVAVDSSVLGADCDGYVHYFDEVQMRHHDTAMFKLDVADACEQIEITNRMENIEPLREFTLLSRDLRYDSEIEQYKRKYRRRYADNVEEAVRKNLLVQSFRHMSSGNRQGASFELTINFLSERLVVERRVLLGVAYESSADPGEPFPHSRSELEAQRGRLPRTFDWRKRGGVTAVRYQDTCSSCWAFATVGAVEGALFVETGRLVPLSEQSLVDCAQPYGAHGCKGTWPSFAYNYIKDNGLPALEEYTPYKGEVLQCRADSVPSVTRISGHVNVTADNVLALKVAIKKYGPTVVIIDGEQTSLSSYKSGYYHDARCRKNSPNHAVLAVGWSTHRGETYFILKNSWSAGWGEEGYVRMRAPTNTCGVLRRPSHPRMRAPDVLRVPAAAPTDATPNPLSLR